MSSGRIINFLVILQALIVQNKEFQIKHPLLSKLVNCVLFKYDFEYATPEYYDQCKRNWLSKSVSLYRRNGARYARFTDRSINNSNEEQEMEAPAARDSILDLFEEGEEEEEKKEESDKVNVTSEDLPESEEQDLNGEEKKKKIKETLEEEDNDDDYELDFLSDDNDNDKDKVDDISASENKIKPEGKWPHRGIRKRKRFQNLIFSLLLLYKLKFFAAIPLVVGVLVLLLKTTSMAGFFFALFSAAVGLHNTHYHR